MLVTIQWALVGPTCSCYLETRSSMTLRVTLFDRFIVAEAGGGGPIRLRPRSQRLLVYLLLQRGRTVARRQAAFTLWPDEAEDEALATFRRALNDLRSAADQPGRESIVVTMGGDLRVNADLPIWVDALEFERLIADGRLPALRDAADLYAGDLLSDWDDEWLVVERERLRDLQLGVLRRLVAAHRALAEVETAEVFARRAIALDPLAEAAWRDLIALLYESGDRAAALAAYERLRGLLRDELDATPMAETEAVRAAIVAGGPLPGSTVAAPIRPSAAMAGRPSRLVGRDAELQQLGDTWSVAAGGRGQLAIVSGEAGVGKSRLAAALGDHVTAAGGLALVGHCYPLEQSLPYQPVVEMLRSASSLRHADLAPIFRAEIVRLAPDLLGAGGTLAVGDERALADRRSQLFEALFQAFLALARGQPLLLIVEDVHWAAESTLDWLAYVAPRLGASRILVVATYRTSEVGSTHALSRLRRRLAREETVAALELLPLSADAVRELVGSLSGLRPDAVTPVADRLYRETAGNPFFLHEIVRGLVEAGQIVVSEGRWEGPFIDETPVSALPLPESLRETIGARVGRLSEMARAFVVAAAVTGPVFRYDIVRDAGGWDDERALPALEELLARGFVREVDVQAGFTFGHQLVREVVYADLTAPRRLYWHRRVADALVRAAVRLPLEQQPAAASPIVHHATAAERAELVFQWAPMAAERAREMSAYADALAMLEAAASACDSLRYVPDADLEACERQHIDVLLKRSELMPHVGRSLEEHGHVLQETADLLARFPDERQQARLDLRRSDYLADLRQYEQAAEAALRASERCLALNDQRGAAQGLYQAGRSRVTISQNRDAIGLFEQARELYRSAGDTAGEVMALSGIALAGVGVGQIEVALQHLNRALELSERRGDRLGAARSCYGLAIAWSFYYHSESVLRFAERSAHLYREIGYAWTALRPQLFIAIGSWLGGDLERTWATLVQVNDAAYVIHDSWLEGWAAHMLGRFALEQGDLAQAERFLERAFDLRQGSGEIQNQLSDLAWLGRLRLAQGRVGAALVHTRQAINQHDALAGAFYVWEMPDVFFAHAQALAANRDPTGAWHYVERAHETLMDFVAQIADDSVKAGILAHPSSTRILTAWQTGQVPTS